MIAGVNDLPWVQREKKIRAITLPIMKQMEIDGRWELTRPPTLDEDKEGIDYFVKIKNMAGFKTNQEIPVQFKVRSKAKYQDLIVARYQPCYGVDQEILPRSQKGLSQQTAEGRDWRGLVDKVSVLYFVATMNEYSEFDQVSFITSDKLRKYTLELDDAWENCTPEGKIKPKSHFTKTTIHSMLSKNGIKDRRCVFYQNPGDEVWYQKNKNESPKFLMYIHKSRRSGFCKIDPVELCKTKQQLKEEGLI